MEQICELCNRLFQDDDEIKAVVIARFKALKSKRVYAISQPTDCLELIHRNCNFPQGDPDNEY